VTKTLIAHALDLLELMQLFRLEGAFTLEARGA
jgi:hypothetical protein